MDQIIYFLKCTGNSPIILLYTVYVYSAWIMYCVLNKNRVIVLQWNRFARCAHSIVRKNWILNKIKKIKNKNKNINYLLVVSFNYKNW